MKQHYSRPAQHEYIPSPAAERVHQWRKWLAIIAAIGAVINLILVFFVN